jgi:Zn-dependent protease with chaperone function
MIVATAHLVGALLIGIAGPSVLRRLPAEWPPRLTLLAWVSSVTTTLGLLVLAALSALWPDPAPAEQFVTAIARCATVVFEAIRTDFNVLYVIIVVAIVSVVVFRTTRSWMRYALRSGKIRRLHRDMVAVVGDVEPDSPDVLWISHPQPMAYCVGGRSGFVVATTALRTDLPAEAREAVLAHEFAHLRSHHHRMIGLCSVVAVSLPILPLFRQAPHAVSILTEMDADLAAARQTSPSAVRRALLHVGTTLVGNDAAATDSTSQRVRSLDNYTIRPTVSAYIAACCAPLFLSVVGAAIALPALSILVHGLTA